MARTPPPLPTVILPSSGYTVEFHPIGSLAINDLAKGVRKERPAPATPLNRVAGLDGAEHDEPNEADPEYQAALAAYEAGVNAEVGARMMKLIARRIVMAPEDVEEAQRTRADMLDVGAEPPEDDRDLFLTYLLIGDVTDIAALQAAFTRRSQPTEEAIQEKVADFQGDVQGP